MGATAILNRMTEQTIQAEIEKFNTADDNATFSPESIAIVLDVSLSWLQKKRCEGNGIPFSKLHYRKIIYKKADVIAYINGHRVSSTSQLTA